MTFYELLPLRKGRRRVPVRRHEAIEPLRTSSAISPWSPLRDSEMSAADSSLISMSQRPRMKLSSPPSFPVSTRAMSRCRFATAG